MENKIKPKLEKGRIYLKEGKWVVRYETTQRVKGGSPKQLGSYNTIVSVNYIPILPEDTKNLVEPYSQRKETSFELILKTDIENGYKHQPIGTVGFIAETKSVWYAKLWPISEMAQDLQHYLETTPQEEIDKTWKETEELDLVGPTVEEFLGIGEQLKMIPKSEMKQGWYNGHCRNSHMAYWDMKEQVFYHISYSFNFYMDKIEHFEDVKDKRLDGFIPIERIERINWVDVHRIKEEVGY